jgi:hypothetical protein
MAGFLALKLPSFPAIYWITLHPANRPTRGQAGSTYLFCVHSGDCFYYAKGFVVKAANKRIAKANGFCYSVPIPEALVSMITIKSTKGTKNFYS